MPTASGAHARTPSGMLSGASASALHASAHSAAARRTYSSAYARKAPAAASQRPPRRRDRSPPPPLRPSRTSPYAYTSTTHYSSYSRSYTAAASAAVSRSPYATTSAPSARASHTAAAAATPARTAAPAPSSAMPALHRSPSQSAPSPSRALSRSPSGTLAPLDAAPTTTTPARPPSAAARRLQAAGLQTTVNDIFSSAPALGEAAPALTSTTTGATYSTPQPAARKAASVPRGLVGLQNLGNTCFMNSALQCLFNTPELVEFFTSGAYLRDLRTTGPTKGRLAKTFADLIESMQSARTSVSPTVFKKEVGRFAPRFVGYSQQDSHEFLRFLLDGLNEDLNRVHRKPPYVERKDAGKLPVSEQADLAWSDYVKRNNSGIIDIFGGQLVSSVRCLTCSYQSLCFDPFLDVSVSIPRAKQVRERYGRLSSNTSSTSACTLDDCLEEFIKEETLDGDDLYKCESCKERRVCTKRLQFYRLPSVLVISLKRFSDVGFREKVSTNVNFPIAKLDLSAYMLDRGMGAQYELFAVSNHMGGVGGGHYTATCRNAQDHKWYSFNDSHVSPTTSGQALGPAAYVLFYRRLRV